MLEIAPGIFSGWLWLLCGLLGKGMAKVGVEGTCDHGGGQVGVMGLMQDSTTLASLVAQSGFDPGPVLLPTTRTKNIAKRQHGVDMLFCPVHAWAFQAGLDDQLVTTLHHATADRPALRLKERVLHLGFPFFQISQIASDRVCSGIFSL